LVLNAVVCWSFLDSARPYNSSFLLFLFPLLFMNVLFEEDGAFRAGAVLADNVSSLQVALPTGRRVKVKAAHVLLRFETPTAATLLAEAEARRRQLRWIFCGK
jgi:hypothetical protein